MPTYVWLVFWAIAIGTLAFFTIREIRRGKKQPPEFDRFQHEAVREASMNMDARGINGGSSLWGG
jgi:hypothetical protein